MNTSELTAGNHPETQLPRHRPDIQGLRAVAVLLVVAFHAGLPVSGGFIGVDVFFVISGFVITNMLLREWVVKRHISLGRFWRRRFFRLAPALSLVVFVTFVLSALLLLPLQQRVAYQTGLGAIFFVANIVIARTTGGYFDPPAELNPLLNTWSLSVEEQFYALFPLVLVLSLLVARRLRFHVLLPVAAIAAITVVSFTLAMASTTPLGEGITWLNFYSPVTRAWEFAIGSLLAVLTFYKPPLGEGTGKALRWLGGIALTISAFVISPETPFPGPWTLLPVSATLLLILGGRTNQGRSRLLTHPVLVRIGDWSYSIYLWHWPAIVFAVALGVREPIWLTLVAIASFAPAVVSYHFVETPLRNWSPRLTRTRLVAAGAIIIPPILLVPVLTVVATPQPRFNGNTGLTYLDTIAATAHECNLRSVASPAARCFQSQPSGPTDLLILGDSHAEDLFLGFSTELSDLNVEYVYLPDWPDGDVLNAKQVAAEAALNPDLRAVIINARWRDYTASDEDVQETLRPLIDVGVPIFIGDDRPRFSFLAEKCQYQPILGPRAQCSESSLEFEDRYRKFIPFLEEFEKSSEDIHILNTADGYCTSGSCSMVNGKDLVYADNGHLNEIGSQQVASRVLNSDEQLQAILLGRTP